MATLLHARGVTHTVGGQRLFDDLELAVNDGDRLGLVGHNGSGKSTLLRVLAGELEPDEGELTVRRGLALGAVEQFLPEALAGVPAVTAVEQRLPAERGWRAPVLLSELGLDEGEHWRPVGALSGGQQNRLMLARALAGEPELLLLDEPTNHLDLATLVVFERVLADFPGALVLVSHDREFLDAVTASTAVLRDARLYRFESSCSAARVELERMDAAARERRAAEERRIQGLRDSARRLASWGRVYDNEKFVRRAKSMEKRIERLEEERTFVTRGSPLDLSLELGDSRSRRAVAVADLPVRAGARTLFRIDEVVLAQGERVALLGHNGAGKSTFVRALVDAYRAAQAVGEAQHQAIRFSPQTQLGYYDQELAEAESGGSMFEFVQQRAGVPDQRAHGALVDAGFPYAEHGRAVGDMSGGERARLLFLVLSLARPNLLVMDEPTNHIDIDGKEQLEAQLLTGSATLLITSHDRRFLCNVAERFLWIRGGVLEEIHDPERFFASTPAPQADASRGDASDAGPATRRADAALERIVELEALLEADLARKPRFQKPRRQAEWRAEIERLYRQLET